MRLFQYKATHRASASLRAGATVVGVCALALTACSGGSAPSGSNALPPQSQSAAQAGAATSSPIPFKFQTVDDPNGGVNEVTGINQLGKIVGTYGSGESSNIYASYSAQPPYTHFRRINYNGAQGTFATALSTNRIVVGYVVDAGSQAGIQGFVKSGGVFGLIANPNEGTGSNAVTELLGINNSDYAVGFYTNAKGENVPFEIDVKNQAFVKLNPTDMTGAVATGINGKNDIAGWGTTPNGIRGYMLRAGTYYQFWYPGAHSTYATSMNWDNQIVGYYVDASGKTHGFMLTGANKGGTQQVWQTIDEPNAASGTWVMGINNHHQICGYYVDAKGVQHGFVAGP